MYTTKDVLKLFDIRRECFREWVVVGFVSPTKKSPGRGHAAYFCKQDLYWVYLFKELVGQGVQRWYAGRIIKAIKKEVAKRNFDINEITYCVYAHPSEVVCIGKSIRIEKFATDLNTGSLFYNVYDFELIRKTVNDMIDKARMER